MVKPKPWIERTRAHIAGNFFLRIVLIYLVVALALIVTFWTFARAYLLRGLDQELERLERNKLLTTRTTLNLMLGEMSKAAVNLAINTRLQQFAYLPREAIPEHQLDVRGVQELLSNTINSSSYIRNIIVYYERNSYILDYSGLLGLDQYYDRGWLDGYRTMTESSLFLEVRSVRERSANEGRAGTQTLTLITGFPYGYLERQGAVVFLIEEQLCRDLLHTIAPAEGEALAVLTDAHGRIMSTSQDAYRGQTLAGLQDLPDGRPADGSSEFKIRLNGERTAVYATDAGIQDWRLYYILPLNQLYEKSSALQLILLGVLSALLILLSAGFMILASRLCDPIRRTMQIVRTLPIPRSEALSDVKAIDSSVRMLYTNNRLLEQQLEAGKLTLREHFLNQLASGRIFSRQEALERAGYLDIDLRAGAYKAAIVQLNQTSADEPDFEAIERELNRFGGVAAGMFDRLEIQTESFRDPEGDPVLLWKLDDATDLQEQDSLIEQTLEELHRHLRSFSELNFSIGVGRIHPDISGIRTSFLEAVQALRYKYLEEDSGIILYEQIAGNREELLESDRPADGERRLINQIDMGDSDGAIALFKEMLQSILHNGRSFQRIERDLEQLAGVIPRSAAALQLDLNAILGDQGAAVPVSHFRSLSQFSDWMSNRLRQVCEYRLDQLRGAVPDFRAEVTQYLADVYRQEISLVSVAEHFQYSPSYFSKTFREKIGVSFWDYVTRLRVDHARALLRDRNDSVEQVALAVGYNNRYSFIRSFKKITALTPSEYRDQILRASGAGRQRSRA